MKVLSRLFGRRPTLRAAAERLLTTVSSQSRRAVLYEPGLAEDTFEGRFEVMTLHATIVMRRLRELGEDGQDLAQVFFDRIFSSFDYALREIGTGDLTVGKKIRKLGEAFYGRARRYDDAFAEDASGTQLEDALAENILGADPNPQMTARLAGFARDIERDVAATPPERLLRGEVDWST